MPTAFHTCLIKIGCQGDITAGAPSFATKIRNVEAFEVFTTEGEALRVQGGNGADCFWYSWWVCKEPYASYHVGGDSTDEECMIEYVIPLSFDIWRWFNHAGQFAGMDLEIADRLRVTFGSDANTIMDSRQATVMAFGLKKPSPIAWRTTIPDAYTCVVGQSHWSELPTDTRLEGVWTFHTTGWNADTANIDLTVDEQRLAYGRTSFFKRVKLAIMQQRVGFSTGLDPNLYLDPPTDCYTWWPLDPCGEGSGEPNPGNLVVESVGGVAEATRVYPVVWRLLR